MKNMLKKGLYLPIMLILGNSTAFGMHPIGPSWNKDVSIVIPIVPNEINISKLQDTGNRLAKTSFNWIATGASIFGLIWLKRYYDLHCIEQWLIQSSPIIENREYLSLSGWNMHNLAMNKGFKILNNSEYAIEELLDALVTNKDFEGYDFETLQRKLIAPEKLALQKKLTQLATFTAYPEILKKTAQDLIKLPSTNNKKTNNLILLICENLVNSPAQFSDLNRLKPFEDLMKTTKRQLGGKNIFLDYFLMNHCDTEQKSMLKNIFSWLKNVKIVNSTKATELYHNLLQRYVRLLAFEKVIKDHIKIDKSLE